MQKILLSLCLCLFGTAGIAQNPTLDSLERLFQTATGDAQRLQWLEQMTNIAIGTDLKAALGYAKRGLQLAEAAGDKTWQPKFCEMQGRMHANHLQLDSAMLFFDRAMTGYTAIGDKKGQATTTFKQAWVYKKRNQLSQATEADLRALRLMEAIRDQEGIADALSRVAEDLYLQERAEDGLQYALRSIEIAERNGLQGQWVYSMRTAGFIQFKLRQPEQALRYFDQALAKAKTLDFTPIELARLLNDRGNALKHLQRYPEALETYRECLQIAEKQQIDMAISATSANLGEVYLRMGRYADALPYLLKAIELMERNGDFYNLEENYRHISKTYEHLGNFQSALFFERKSRQVNDSTLNAVSDAKMSELRTQYETEKKEATIAAQASQLSQQRMLQWLSFGIAALLGLLAFNFRRNAIARKKANALLAAKNQENELLLKEIHHRVKNNLEVVSSLLALQSAQIDDQGIKDAMQEGQNRVQSIGIVHQKLYQRDKLAAIEMKDYFLNLSESVLDSFGADDRVSIECAMDQLDVDIDTAVPLGLIVNELLTNTLKYAFPDGRKGKVRIKLEKNPAGMLHLEVADDGVGKSGLTHGTGFGGQLVALLTRQLSGTMREEVKNGTTVIFDFNLKKAA
ncbi:MAG: tetratricopeptide repeat protein [Saprospiraceae bacterium]|nr:tetratricopeptide repeat protein [Saprospiraceae bacterium]